MAGKRSRDPEDSLGNASNERPEKKTKKKGFSVGPEHLPDGTYRRKSELVFEREG